MLTFVTVPLTIETPGFGPASAFRTVGLGASFEPELQVQLKTEATTLAEQGVGSPLIATTMASAGPPRPAHGRSSPQNCRTR